MGEFQKKDIVILGISPDSEASHQKFIAQNDLPFTLLCDPEKKVMTRYEAFGEKKMYGKVVEGVIRSTVWVGPDGKVKKHWHLVLTNTSTTKKNALKDASADLPTNEGWMWCSNISVLIPSKGQCFPCAAAASW